MAGIAGGTARVYDGPETAVASDHRPVLAKLIIRGPRAGGGQ